MSEHRHEWNTSVYQPDSDNTRLWCHCGQLATQDGETGMIAERPGFLIITSEPHPLNSKV